MTAYPAEQIIPRLRRRLHVFAFWGALVAACVLVTLAPRETARVACVIYGSALARCSPSAPSTTVGVGARAGPVAAAPGPQHHPCPHRGLDDAARRARRRREDVDGRARVRPGGRLGRPRARASPVLTPRVRWPPPATSSWGWAALAAAPPFPLSSRPRRRSARRRSDRHIAGAAVYATRRPNRWPAVFGFHEVFNASSCAAISHFVAFAGSVVRRLGELVGSTRAPRRSGSLVTGEKGMGPARSAQGGA